MSDTTEDGNQNSTEGTAGFVTARFDRPHEAVRTNPVNVASQPRIQPRRARVRVGMQNSAEITADSAKTWAEQLHSAEARHTPDPASNPSSTSDDPMPSLAEFEELAPLAARHADDIAWHLTQRLQEVERRELDLAEYSSRLQEAEAAAQAWVMERETDFQSRERDLHLQQDELATRLAATAAVEISAQEEQTRWRAMCDDQLQSLQKREALFTALENRCQAERNSLDAALERFQAEKHQQEEQFRARRQQWDRLCEQDRAQADRLQQNLTRHRKALEQREQQLRAQEAALANLRTEQIHAERLRLETERLRMEAAQERRIATEQRWIAGRLWAKLMDANLVSNDELALVLKQVRQELENTYRRERESLERVRLAMLTIAQGIVQAPHSTSDTPTTLKRPLRSQLAEMTHSDSSKT